MAIETITLPDGRKRVFITAGTASWPQPSDWNKDDNEVECVGRGGAGSATGPANTSSAGGGGGAYAVAHDVDPTFPVAVEVDGGATRFGVSGANFTDCLCGADAGGNGTTVAGRGGEQFHPAGFRGGDGSVGFGGSGGGAASPTGAGGDASTPMSSLFADVTPTTSQNAGPYHLGINVGVNQPVWLYGMRYWSVPGQGTIVCEVWRPPPAYTLAAHKIVPPSSITGWREVLFEPPILVTQPFILTYRPAETTAPIPYQELPAAAALWNRPGPLTATGGAYGSLPPYGPWDPSPTFYLVDPIYSLEAPPTTYRGFDGIDLGNSSPQGGTTNIANGQVGVLFSVSAPGRITAIRFLKIEASGSSNRVRLWQVGLGDLNGTLIADATANTGSGNWCAGWVQVPITPRTVDASHRYIATVDMATQGPWTSSGLASAIVSGPLRLTNFGGIRNTSQGLTPDAFTFESGNYWVDVVFDGNDVKGGATSGVAVATNGADGNSGDEWDAYGIGGGGAGGVDATRTGAGADFGGGGGGPFNDTTSGPGNVAGGKGAVVITYEPIVRSGTMAQTILLKRRIPGSGAPNAGTGVGEVRAGEPAVAISADAAGAVADMFVGSGAFVQTLVSASRQVELAGAQDITGAKTFTGTGSLTIDVDDLHVEGGADGDFITTDGSGGLSFSRPVSSGTTPPATPDVGDVWYDTDAEELMVWNGTDWVRIGGTAPSTTAPTNPSDGDLWYDLTNEQLMVFDGTDWIRVSGAQASTTAPTTNITEGDQWFNTTTNRLMIYNGSTWVQAGGLDPFVATDTYAIGDYVHHGGYLYRAIAANGPGAFDGDDWDRVATLSDIEGQTLSDLEIADPLHGDGLTAATALGVTPATTAQIDTGTDNVFPVTSAGLRHTQGAAVSTLATTAKTIVPAINELNTQIGALSGAIRLVGAYDADQDEVTAGAGSPAVDGDPLPAAAPANEGWYVIVDVAGTGTGNAPPVALHAGDWLVSTGSAWVHIPLNIAHMAAGNVSVTTIDAQSWTNVQAALQGLFDKADAIDSLADLEIEDPLHGDGLTAGTALGVTPATTAQIGTGTDDVFPVTSAGLRSQLGANVTALTTTAQTIVPAINELDSRVGAVTGALIFAGTYDVPADEMSPARPTLTQDDPLPAASAANEGYYLIVTTAGMGINNAPHVQMELGDWIVSNGTQWIHIPLHHVAMTAANVGLTAVDSQTWTNVQDAIQGLFDAITTPGSAAVVADDVSITGDGTTGDPLMVAVVDGGTF